MKNIQDETMKNPRKPKDNVSHKTFETLNGLQRNI